MSSHRHPASPDDRRRVGAAWLPGFRRGVLRVLCALSSGGVAAASMAQTAPMPETAPVEGETWMTVGDALLDTLRGGFDLGGGVRVSFGISKAVSVNGVLTATTSFHIADVGRITPAQAAAFDRQVAGAGLVQVGAGNALAAGTALPNAATVVQNTLDNQTLQTRTVIDTTTNGMSMAKGLHTGATLQDALINSVRAR